MVRILQRQLDTQIPQRNNHSLSKIQLEAILQNVLKTYLEKYSPCAISSQGTMKSPEGKKGAFCRGLGGRGSFVQDCPRTACSELFSLLSTPHVAQLRPETTASADERRDSREPQRPRGVFPPFLRVSSLASLTSGSVV